MQNIRVQSKKKKNGKNTEIRKQSPTDNTGTLEI